MYLSNCFDTTLARLLENARVYWKIITSISFTLRV